MINSKALLADLRRLLRTLEPDLRTRIGEQTSLAESLEAEWKNARDAGRTGVSYIEWLDDEITQAAVHWILGCVYIRFLEDNHFLERPYLGGPDQERLALARDRHEQYFRAHPTESDREYLLACFRELALLPGMSGLFDERHNPVFRIGLSGDGAMQLLGFWQKVNPDTGLLVHDFSDSESATRFLGDLYQDLSEAARKRYALLQTPVFVEEFILDRTLTPAIDEFGYREVRLIDPTCGSGHFVLGAFQRLFDLWARNEPAHNLGDLVQKALDGVYGVDLNPYAVAIARFRLLIVALKACGVTRLKDAPAFRINLAAGDSLLHGRRFNQLDLGGEAENLARSGLRHAYQIEDLDAVNEILGRQYHAVVGNPPYITVKDAALNAAYRARYATCHRTYSLGVPFTERFFELAISGEGTSTLELGIDVGDLDYVIQIDAPSTVSSFLLRMGRTGRRASSKRNCLFLTTTDEAFLIACALSQLWKEGYVEPVVPPPDPWHLVAQQAMALVLQSKDLGLKECSSKVASLFPELPESGICKVLNHMCATDILCVNDALLGFGRRGEKLYGRQNFLDLLSSFASPLQLLVRHGSSDLGYIDPISVQGKQDEDRLILLGGHSWRITSIDWSKRAVWVEPTRDPGKARWVGSGRSLAFEICQAIKRVLTGAGLGIGLSKRGIAKLESLRGELPVFNPASTTIEHMTNGRTRWWTFAGGRANWQLAQSMRAPGAGLRIDDFYIEKNGTVAIHEVRERLKALDLIDLSADLINSKAIDLKFQEAVPTHLLASVALKRALDRASAEQVLAQSIDTEPGCDHPSTKQTLADDKPLTMHPRRE